MRISPIHLATHNDEYRFHGPLRDLEQARPGAQDRTLAQIGSARRSPECFAASKYVLVPAANAELVQYCGVFTVWAERIDRLFGGIGILRLASVLNHRAADSAGDKFLDRK